MTEKMTWTARIVLVTATFALALACWNPGSSTGDYTVSFTGEATVTVNDEPFEWSDEDGGYVGILPIEDESAPFDELRVVLDPKNPEAARDSECGEFEEEGRLRICVCSRNADGALTGLCESMLLGPETWNITAPDVNSNGVASQARLYIENDAEGTTFENVSTNARDVVADEAVELKFANAGLFLNGAYGLWAVVLAGQEITINLDRDVSSDTWATSDDRRSFYNGNMFIGAGFLYWYLPAINLHYERDFTLEQS